MGDTRPSRNERNKPDLKSIYISGVLQGPDLQPVAVADAAADNWTFLSTLAPGDLQLIDYWHACQHLKCVADHAFGGDPAAAETWFQKYRGILGNDEDGVERVIRAIRYRHAANGKSVAALERELKFFRKHRRRMRYAVHQVLFPRFFRQ